MKIILLTITIFFSFTAFADHSGMEGHSHHDQKVEKSVKVEINKKGFKPASALNFKKNENIVLKIKRTTEKTCMKSLKHPKTGELITLPLNKEIRFEIGSYKKPTEVTLLCGMGMKAAVIHVKNNYSDHKH